MLQGDAYPLRFTLKDKDGTTITDEMVSDVEIIVGALKKTYAKGEISYSDGKWFFNLTQEDTLNAPARWIVQTRVKFLNNSEVVGKTISPIRIEYGHSKDVL